MIDNIDIRFNEKDVVQYYVIKSGNYLQPKWISANGYTNTYPIKKKDNNIEIKVTETQASLSNSLHKYFNIYKYGKLGEHNHNDFYYFDVLEALNVLQRKNSNLNLSEGTISSLEFGFNLITERLPKYYLDFNFLLYKHKAPVINKGINSMNYKKFEHSNIAFKVYDKKTQYGLGQNVLRIEIVFKSRELKKLGICTFNDLKKEENFILLFNSFMKHFEGFTIVDNRFEGTKLKKEFIDDLGNRLEPSYWKNYRGTYNINRLKNKLREIIVKNNLNKTEKYFKALIKNKFNELFYLNCSFNNIC